MEREPPVTLGVTLDPERMRPVLERLIRARWGDRLGLRGLQASSVHRRVMRFALDLAGPGAGQVPASLVGKVYETAELGRKGFDSLLRLGQAGFDRDAPDGIHVPEAVAYLEHECLLLMEDVPATTLRNQIRSRTATASTWELFARATAKLHACPLVLGAPSSVDDHLAQREPVALESLIAAHPELAPTIERVLACARAWHGRLSRSALGICHGDYHLGQPHVDGRHLWLLDLDRLHRGDPMSDLAMVFINLRRLEQRDGLSPSIRPVLGAFLETYFSAGDWGAAGRIPLYAALIHLKKALKHQRWQREVDWRDRLRRQVANAAECLALGHDGRGPRDPPAGLDDVLAFYARCPVKV